MKRLRALVLVCLVCALAVGLSSRPAEALFCYCDTSSSFTTAIVSGTGSDCTYAQTALTSQLQQLARATCLGYCNFNITTTKACFQLATGEYRIKGYATYSCRACEDGGTE